MLWYATGNLSQEDATQITSQAIGLLNLESIPKEELPETRVVDLSTHSD